MQAQSIMGGRFQLHEQVATGGMGRVYRARDRRTGAWVALKVLFDRAESARGRFLREASVLAAVEHPSVVRYVAHGQADDGSVYLAMEWLDGVDLRQFLAARHASIEPVRAVTTTVPARVDEPRAVAGPTAAPILARATDDPTPVTLVTQCTIAPAATPSSGTAGDAEADGRPRPHTGQLGIEESLVLGCGLCAAVAELHRCEVVHRDIKPSNIFLPDAALGRLKLIDLGAAWRVDELGSLTREGHFLGTPYYMAPEQIQSRGQVSPSTDIWAMGVVLYECLTGTRPFLGDGLPAVLASILMEEPVPPDELRPEIPGALAELVMRMLRKPPETRPQRAAELGRVIERMLAYVPRSRPAGTYAEVAEGPERIEDIEMDQVAGAAPLVGLSEPAAAADSTLTLTGGERRLSCMLFVENRDQGVTSCEIARTAESFGGEVTCQVGGTSLVTIPGQHEPVARASLGARVALALNGVSPQLGLVLVTGHTSGDRAIHLAASQAVMLQAAVQPGVIRLDEFTASLLESRFHVGRDDTGHFLGAERISPVARNVLGAPTTLRGRRRALATLGATFDECVESEAARVVVVTADAGMGKSRLTHEFLDQLRRRGEPFQLMYAAGDMARSGSNLMVVCHAIRQAAGILHGEPDDIKRHKLRARISRTVVSSEVDRIAAVLGEVVGLEFPVESYAGLAAARADSGFLGDLSKRAFADWLAAECEHTPLLFVVEDLHWCDWPSIDHLDAALGALVDARFMLLCLARPEIEDAWPRLWRRRSRLDLPLEPLSPKESAAIVAAALGSDLDESVVARMVELAQGNPFCLEELIRTVASGSRQLPDTVLAIAQSRLDDLAPEAKGVLRAASVFGETFWLGGVCALVEAQGGRDVATWLEELEARELVQRQSGSRIPRDIEYRFYHALVQEAAYSLLTEHDTRVGHALASSWLEAAGEEDPLVLGEHLVRGGKPERAVPYFAQAAERALASDDFDAAMEHAERAATAGAKGSALGAIRAVETAAALWRSDHARSRDLGFEATALLHPGSAAWFRAMADTVVACHRLGDHEAGLARTLELSGAACEPGAEGAQLASLCRAAFQVYFNGLFDHAEPVLDQIVVLAENAARLDVRTRAQLQSTLSIRARLIGEIDEALRTVDQAIELFARADDARNVVLEKISKNHLLVMIGRYDRAIELAEELIEDGREFPIARGHGLQCLGFSLCMRDGPSERGKGFIAAALEREIELGNPRAQGNAHLCLAEVALREDDVAAAVHATRAAVELLADSRPLLARALALHALALLACDRLAEAVDAAERGYAIRQRFARHLYGDSVMFCAVARALQATGRADTARDIIAHAAELVRERAERISDPETRRQYLDVTYNRAVLDADRGARA